MHFLNDDKYIALHFKVCARSGRLAFVFASVVDAEEAAAQCAGAAALRDAAAADPLPRAALLRGGATARARPVTAPASEYLATSRSRRQSSRAQAFSNGLPREVAESNSDSDAQSRE